MMNTIAIGTIGTDGHGRKVVFAEDGWHIVKKNGEMSTRKTTDTEIMVDRINEDTMEVLEMIEHKTKEQIEQEIAEMENAEMEAMAEAEEMAEEIIAEMEAMAETTQEIEDMEQEIEPYDAIAEYDINEDIRFNTVKIIPIKGTENVRVKLYRTNKFIADIGLYNAYEVINDSKTGKEKKQRIDNTILKEMIIDDARMNGYIFQEKQTQTYNGLFDTEDCIDMLAMDKIIAWNKKNPQHTLVLGDMEVTSTQIWDTYSDGRIKDATITINTTTFDNYDVEVMVYVKSGQTTALKGYDKVAINKQRKADQKKVDAQ